MPLTPPAVRRSRHVRTIICEGYERDDGLWDIEAHLVDIRGESYTTPWRGEIKAGEPGHEMWLRWTVGEDLVIRAIEVVTDVAPYPDSCPHAAAPYQALVGLNVGRGFIKEVQARVARTDGCTHLFTLIQAAANSTMQTLAGHAFRQRQNGQAASSPFGTDKARPGLLDTCRTYASSSPIVKILWPAHYTGSGK